MSIYTKSQIPNACGSLKKHCCFKRQVQFPVTGKRCSNICKVENGDGLSQVVSGPIVINQGNLPASDPVTAASQPNSKPVDRSKGLWTRCDKCGGILYVKHLKEHNHICLTCNFHLKMSSQERVDHLIDPGTWRSLDDTLSPVDPLEFTDMKAYTDRIKEAQDKTGMQDAIRTGTGLLHGIPVALGVMEFAYMGGSMGSVVGEKLTRLIEYATQEGLALLVVCASGGARMQEGILSLMQMAKISAALHVHQNEANLLYISILTSPTTGGVTASFGMLGDIIIAEPQAIIGFAGRRVIEQTLQEELPDNFQTAEYLLEHGLLDLVIPRSFLKGALYETINFYKEAPFKRRGYIPYGVQQGLYLTTEESLRQKLLSAQGTNGNGNGNGSHAGFLVSSSDGTSAESVSFRELVGSFSSIMGNGNGSSEGGNGASEHVLSEALSLARSGRVEWLAHSEPEKQTSDKQFIFRLATDAKN